jgi:hypothetical protein
MKEAVREFGSIMHPVLPRINGILEGFIKIL